MIPFPNNGLRERDEKAAEVAPHAMPGEGEPAARGLIHGQGWQPVPSGYDWYGATDPEGLAEACPPFGSAAGSPVSPAAGQ
jgi:hypothetical protein